MCLVLYQCRDSLSFTGISIPHFQPEIRDHLTSSNHWIMRNKAPSPYCPPQKGWKITSTLFTDLEPLCELYPTSSCLLLQWTSADALHSCSLLLLLSAQTCVPNHCLLTLALSSISMSLACGQQIQMISKYDHCKSLHQKS